MFGIVVFVVASWSWLPYMVFSISPAVGDFHEFCKSLRLLLPKLFDIRFSSDAVTEGVDSPVDRNIFSSVQEFGETPNVRANRFCRFLSTLP
jgi:hypothetical protein